MAITVLSVAYPFSQAGRDAVGGSEQVLTQLDAALVEAGECSLVLACSGSSVRGTLIPLDSPFGILNRAARAEAYTSYQGLLHQILETRNVDVIHMHGVDFAEYAPETNLPVLITLHLPLAWYPAEVFSSPRRNWYFNCVSSSQQSLAPGRADAARVIHNGVPVEWFSSCARKLNMVSALGRICPEKGFHHALDAARVAGVPMLLAGQVFPYPEHQAYFREEIRPRIDWARRFIGPVRGWAKRRLLASSRCLVVPSLAPETSSLVAMEALASGTPVVAFPSGALVEIVDDGVTGYLVTDEREMAQAILRADRLDPDRCRAQARERFCSGRMTAAYLAVYRQLASCRTTEPSLTTPARNAYATASN